MPQNVSTYPAAMSLQQSVWFAAEYEAVRKDEIMGALLAFFLGTFGAHHFYLGNNRLGILYAVFFWTGIPSICGFVECFLMPGRIREYNFAQANAIASRIGAKPFASTAPPPAAAFTSCDSCANQLDRAALFCTRCGASVSTSPQQPVTA